MPPSASTTPLPAPLLVIDGSGPACFAGVLDADQKWIGRTEIDGAPLESLFPAVKAVLDGAGLELEALRGYIYCQGPGSVLGLRLCAMALETWSRLQPTPPPCFAYNSLQLVAACILADHPELENALLVSDWKKGAWNAVLIEAGRPRTPHVADDSEIQEWTAPLFHLPQRKGWQTPPAHATTVANTPARLPELLAQSDLLTPTPGIQLHTSGVNTFQKWIPTRHR